MTFAGLGKPEDRANVIAFLNAHSDSPLPMPAAPAEAAPVAAGKGAKEPVLDRATDRANPTRMSAAKARPS